MFGKLLVIVWRTLTSLAALALLAIFIVVPLVVYFGVFHQPAPQVSANSALVVRPTGSLVEQAPSGVKSVLHQKLSAGDGATVVSNLIAAIDEARRDDHIKKLYLRLDRLNGAEPGQLQDITRAINRFGQSGKKVIAWADNYNQARYALASQADQVVLDPMGQVTLPGYAVYRNYFAEAVDKLGIKIHVFRHGKYKSFAEPLMRSDMSPAAKEANKAWTGSLWQIYRELVSAKRPYDAAAVKQYADNYADKFAELDGNGAQLARQSGLVDQLKMWSEVAGQLATSHSGNGDKLKAIGADSYLAAVNARQSSQTNAEIARIVVAGDIASGRKNPNSANSRTITRLFHTARADDDVAAVLLRVNSPGGGINASESIRRQVVKTQAAGKPVVVSMGGKAASGGYWISMNADQIWAEPSTITGSIGVFGLIPTASKPLHELGIKADGVGTTPLSGLLRKNHPLTDRGRKIMQSDIDYAYQQFVTKVAKARDLSRSKVHANAQGRVWTGRAAKRIGLVDHLGGPVQATQALAKLADLKSGQYRVRTIQPPSSLDMAVQNFLSAHIQADILPGWLIQAKQGGTAGWLKHHLNDPKGRYARCFCRVSQAGLD
ncbi:signal peptide peptidase SppA [Salinisphaera orenii]|uniref:signal peptide peptidase SppA n=1 Tax=Salinisphaera orenii TaxID=856731 RepID=UPI000DBE93E0